MAARRDADPSLRGISATALHGVADRAERVQYRRRPGRAPRALRRHTRSGRPAASASRSSRNWICSASSAFPIARKVHAIIQCAVRVASASVPRSRSSSASLKLLQRLFIAAELVQCIANVVADRGFPALRRRLRRCLDDGERLLPHSSCSAGAVSMNANMWIASIARPSSRAARASSRARRIGCARKVAVLRASFARAREPLTRMCGRARGSSAPGLPVRPARSAARCPAATRGRWRNPCAVRGCARSASAGSAHRHRSRSAVRRESAAR